MFEIMELSSIIKYFFFTNALGYENWREVRISTDFATNGGFDRIGALSDETRNRKASVGSVQ